LTRNRIIYALLISTVIVFGLASRHYPNVFPKFITTYAGDTLWALMVFLLIGFISPRLATLKLAVLTLLFAFLIELSQLYHAPWIDGIRAYSLAALVLGHGFLWSDLVCYSVGVAIGALAEWVFFSKNCYGFPFLRERR
jgi:hypothetical protein